MNILREEIIVWVVSALLVCFGFALWIQAPLADQDNLTFETLMISLLGSIPIGLGVCILLMCYQDLPEPRKQAPYEI